MDNPHNASQPYFACEPFDVDFYDSAPARYTTVVELPVSPAALFEIFDDPDSWPKWAPGIGKVVWTSERPFGVGTTRTVIFWGGMEVYERFFRWDPGKEMAFYFEGITQEIWTRFGEHYAVEDLGDGRCKLTWRVAYAPTGTFATIHGLVRPFMAVNFRVYMALLRRYCRRHAAALTAGGMDAVPAHDDPGA